MSHHEHSPSTGTSYRDTLHDLPDSALKKLYNARLASIRLIHAELEEAQTQYNAYRAQLDDLTRVIRSHGVDIDHVDWLPGDIRGPLVARLRDTQAGLSTEGERLFQLERRLGSEGRALENIVSVGLENEEAESQGQGQGRKSRKKGRGSPTVPLGWGDGRGK